MSEFATGYFTIDSAIRGLGLAEMEDRLGLPKGYLAGGATVLLLLRPPTLEEFEPRGSTRFESGKGLSHSRLHETKAIPGAWSGRRLVKVRPTMRDAARTDFREALESRAEQWELLRPIPARVLCVLEPGMRFWG
ncbi:MAG: hypothetical protein JNM84_19210 [Planctomycetes bacterium]|nr:hypothetical protein [Planctomycetota bacterium]